MFKKIILVLLTLITLVLIGLFIFAFVTLPSPQKIASALKAAGTDQSPQETMTTTGQEQPTPPANSTSVGANTKDLDKNKFNHFIQKFLDEDQADIRVCNNLGTTRFFQLKNQGSKLYEALLSDDSRTDSVGEALRYPVRAILQDEQVSALMTELISLEEQNLKDLEGDEKYSFLNKAGFYSRLAATAGHVLNRKEEFETMGNRANHLAVIAKIVALKPDLANDLNIKQFCHELQTSISQKKEVDIKAERQEILKMIEYAGLKAEQLDFKPDKYINLKIQLQRDSFGISMDN